MLTDVVERFADDLDDVRGNFRGSGKRTLSADEGDRDAALLLEFVEKAARGGRDAGPVHIQRTHVAHVRAHVPHLRFRQLLKLLQLLESGFAIALQNLAEDLEAHLDADEALQRAIVKIGGDPLSLRFPRCLHLLLQAGGLFSQGINAFFEPPLLQRKYYGKPSGHKDRGAQDVGRTGIGRGEEQDADAGHERYLARAEQADRGGQ